MMEYALLVCVIQRGAKLLSPVQNFSEFRRAGAHQLFQALALYELRSHEDGEALVAARVETSNRRMVQGAGSASLGQNALEQTFNVIQPLGHFTLAGARPC